MRIDGRAPDEGLLFDLLFHYIDCDRDTKTSGDGKSGCYFGSGSGWGESGTGDNPNSWIR